MAYTLVLPFHGILDDILQSARTAREEGSAEGIREVLLAHNGKVLPPEKQAEVDALCAPADASHPAVRFVHTDRKGLGAGYRLGIAEATEEFVVLSADDLPFGWTDLRAFERAGRPDFAIGSKAHPDSKVKGVTFKRQVSTFGFKTLRRLVLGWNTPGDSQGSLIVRTAVAKAFLPELHYDNYLSSLELATLHLHAGGKIVEVPIENKPPQPTSISFFKDSALMARGLFELRGRRRG